MYWSAFVNSIIVESPSPPPSPAKVPAPAPNPEASTPINLPAGPPLIPSTLKQVQSRIGSGTGLDMANVIFDTSSSLILLPPRVALATHQYIHNWMFGWYSGYSYISGAYTIACNNKADVWIELASPTARVGADQSIADEGQLHGSRTGPAGNGGDIATRRFKVAASDLVKERVPLIGYIFNLCFSGIQASKSDEDDWVLGHSFFVNNYMTLDHHNRQIGIAPAMRPDSVE